MEDVRSCWKVCLHFEPVYADYAEFILCGHNGPRVAVSGLRQSPINESSKRAAVSTYFEETQFMWSTSELLNTIETNPCR